MSAHPEQGSEFLYTSVCHPDAQTMITAIAQSVDITLVDPYLFSVLIPSFNSRILRFQEAKDKVSIEQLQFAGAT